MKKLQSNFTTPEQSKLLLELGVPADSADCYNTTKHIGKIPDGMTYKNVWQMSVWRNKNGSHIEMYPCWSVGRLIEIAKICSKSRYAIRGLFLFLDECEADECKPQVIDYFEICNYQFDFSKLEE